MTTPTQLPIPSNNLLDSRFNFEKLDQIVNSDSSYYTDRFGKQRLTVSGLESLVRVLFEENIDKSDVVLNSVDALRTFSPWYDQQIVRLNSYRVGGRIGGGSLYYDASDTTSIDDGMIVFVTQDGKRLKRLDSEKIVKVEWAGVEEGGDISDAWQKAINFSSSFANKNSDYYRCPTVVLPGGKYTITKGIVTPPFVKTVSVGSVFLDCSGLNDSNDAALWIKGFKGNYQQQGISGYTLSAIFGGIYFEGPGRANLSSLPAIKIGNSPTENSGNGFSNCAPKIKGVAARQFRTNIQITEYDAYLITVEDSDFGNSKSGIQVGTGARTSPWNAGERISFSNCVFYGGGENGLVEINTAGFSLDFTNVSFDYTYSHVFNFSSKANGTNIRLVNTHSEAIGGYVVNDPGGLTDSYITFVNSDFMMTLYSGSQVGQDVLGSSVSNSISRTPFNNLSVNVILENSGPVSASQTPYDYYIFLATPLSKGVTVTKFVTPYANARPSKVNSLLAKGWNFGNEVDGTSVTAGKVLTDWTFRLVNGGTAQVGTLNANGDKYVGLSPSSTSANMYVYWSNNAFIEVTPLESYSALMAVQYGSADISLAAGAQISSNIRFTWYDSTQTQISTETYSYDLYSIIKDTAAPNYASATTRIVPIIPTSRVAPAQAKYLRVEFGIVRVNYPLKICYSYVYKSGNTTAIY